MTVTRKTYIYVRVSTHTQQLGRDVQIETCLAYATTIGVEVPAEHIFVDEDVSSHIPIEKRKAGKFLMDILKPQDNLIILRMDRIFRSCREFENFLKKWLCDNDEICLHIVQQGGCSINGRTPVGRMLLRMLMAFAEFERDMISERTKEALAIKKAQRHRINRDHKIGWKWQQIGVKADGEPLLIQMPDDEEMGQLRVFRQWADEGYSLRQIAAHANTLGLTRSQQRVKMKRGPNGTQVPCYTSSGVRSHETIKTKWDKDSVHRGIQMLIAIDEQQAKSEKEDEDARRQATDGDVPGGGESGPTV